MRLIEAMMRPEFYPHACERVELVQTMMSWLLFAGQFVYKVKKPVQFQFVDAATPARRYQLCQNEVLLNRRLAPVVYLGVSGIAERQGDYLLIADAAATKRNIQEFAVVMRRLPSDRMLDQMMANSSVSGRDIQELAKRLAAFHADASIAKSKVWGSAQVIARLVTGNLAEAQEVAADSMIGDCLTAVQRYARRFLMSHQQSLDNRARDGRLCEGHGDLRCKSVCFAANGFAILDCVESNESLRYGDVASELASLTVDFDLLGRPDLGDELVKGYVAESNDLQLLDLLRFYQCHRAVLRGRLETLESLQNDLPLGQRMAARGNARRLFTLAHDYALGRKASFLA